MALSTDSITENDNAPSTIKELPAIDIHQLDDLPRMSSDLDPDNSERFAPRRESLEMTTASRSAEREETLDKLGPLTIPGTIGTLVRTARLA
jgi:hypothetical protein